jgi:hypothetical protein
LPTSYTNLWRLLRGRKPILNRSSQVTGKDKERLKFKSLILKQAGREQRLTMPDLGPGRVVKVIEMPIGIVV